ncbi:efflux RND transporter periplasmic adaptor subunit [Photobacterium lipolyticum]|nr:efflux RND transporter periplasmic adaptor subunit [Photobacterium lipolyticum]
MSVFRQLSEKLKAKPYLIAITLTLLISVWMVSGQLSQSEDVHTATSKELNEVLPRVRTKEVKAELVTRSVTLYGRTEPDRKTTVAAEVLGQIIEVLAPRGSVVKKGDLIARIDKNDLPQQLDYAQARLKQREIEFDGAKKLSAKGFQGKARLAETEASLTQARADLAKLKLMLYKTEIRAPQSGILNERYIEEGDFVSVGTVIAQIADIDPLIVRADVTEKDIYAIKLGQKAVVRLLNGQQVEGELRYISRVSNVETNTFKIEVSIPNPDFELWAGVSAELSLPLEKTRAIKVSPSLMALDEAGNIGIKTVENGVVSFHPVDLVKTEKDGAWLGGFDESVEVIILGQGFVKAGDHVETTKVEN